MRDKERNKFNTDEFISHAIWDIKFSADCQNKWNFDGNIIVIDSRGYDWDTKSFYVGYYLNITPNDENDPELIAIIEDELKDENFTVLKQKVRQWYRDNFKNVLKFLLEKYDS